MTKTTILPAGSFEVSSGTIRATDPCYTPDTWCAGSFPAKNGKWSAWLFLSDEDDWGVRVAMLMIVHDDHQMQFTGLDEVAGSFGVDSGQFGFFDHQLYEERHDTDYGVKGSFYQTICDLTLDKPGRATIEWGAASSSGLGDGVYEVVARYVKGEAVQAAAIFIEEYEEDEEIVEAAA